MLKHKSLLGLLLSLVILALNIGFKTNPASAFSGGAGTSGNPYLISTPAELASLSSYLGSGFQNTYFTLANDIDLNVSPYNSGSGWTPIGNSSSNFYGRFDGNGFTISNLFISRSGTSRVGLFGHLATPGSVNNVTLANVNVTGYESTGGLVGYYSTTATAENVHVSGVVNGGGANGGAGGIAGWCNTAGTIRYSSSTVNVSSTNRSGSLVGFGTCPIVESFATGNVVCTTSSATWCGGLVGVNIGGSTNSYARGSVTGPASTSNIGGLTGGNFGAITNSYSTGTVTAPSGSGIGGLVGTGASNVTNSFWDTQTSGKATSAAGTGKTTSEMKTEATFTGWTFPGTWGISSSSNDGYPFLAWQSFESAPTVESDVATVIGLTSSTLNGEATAEGTSVITERGFVYGTTTQADPGSAEPASSGYTEVSTDESTGIGTFSTNLTNLTEGETYYYRAYAKNTEGVSYGSEFSFTALDYPTLTSPTSNSATSTIYVDITIHSAAEPGSLNLVFDAGEDEVVLNLTDLAPGQHQFTVDPNDIMSTAEVVSSSSANIPDAIYSVVLQQFDISGLVGLSSISTNVTIDSTSPTIESLSPANGAIGVAVDSNLSLEYNEPVGAHSGDITIYNQTDDSIFEVIPAGGGPISGNGTSTLTINPDNDFEPGSEYYVLMDSGAITDLVGNHAGAILDGNTWTFTAVEAPQVVCEIPTATHETISAHCDIQPDYWGSTTWEARYKKAANPSYTNLSLEDEAQALVTVDGLEPETDYYLEFRFTNDYGTEDWSRLDVTTQGPPQDDFNGDSIADYYQPNIGSYTSSISGKRVVIDVGEDCELTTDDTIDERNLEVQDSQYDYESGLWDFEAECQDPGSTTTIKLYYYDTLATGLSLRKYNPNNQTYFTIDGASLSEREIDGYDVTIATYNITDGGELDMDGELNGTIKDPAGLGSTISGNSPVLAETGANSILLMMYGLLLTSLGLVFFKTFDSSFSKRSRY